MKNLCQLLLSLLFVISSLGKISGQNIDSLKRVYYTTSKNKLSSLKDTAYINLLYQLGRYYQGASPDTAFILHKKSIQLINTYIVSKTTISENDKIALKIKLGEATRQLGWDYMITGNPVQAEKNYHEAIALALDCQKNSTKKNKGYAVRLHAAALCNLGSYYDGHNQPKKAIGLYHEAMLVSDKIKNKVIISSCLGNIGSTYWSIGYLDSAAYYIEKSLPIYKELNNETGIMNSYYMLSQINDDNGNFPDAIKNLHKALVYAQKTGNKRMEGNIYNSIGIVYSHQDQNKKAYQYFDKAKVIAKEVGDQVLFMNSLTNTAILLFEENKFKEAIKIYEDAFLIAEKIEDTVLIAKNHGNIGNVYEKMGDLKKALYHYKIGEELSLITENKVSIAKNKGNIGSVYLKLGQYAKAEPYFKEALQLGEETDNIEIMMDYSMHLSQLYELTNKHKLSLFYYKQHITLRDSMLKVEDIKSTMQQELQFEYSKKATADSVAQLKEKEIANTRIAQQQAELKAKRNIQYALFGGLALVIVFSIFMYNRFKVTKKQNLIIEEQKREVHLQKDIIEEKHKEITDSINYAERIQRSFLASKTFLDNNLNDYFVLFEPKEAVSGDFYWASTLNNGNFIIACADSTGHGVPGAIMSILNISALEKSIEHLNQPDEILNHTRKVIIDRLKNDGSEEGGKDGMDVSLLVLNKERNKLIYSAANNPIWILRNGQIIELSPDKMPVGKHDHDSVPFKKHEIDIIKGDIIYSLTDGMPDQFGGQKGKKYKYNHLKSFLVSIVHLEMNEQRKSILNEFYTWKGDLEQTDDVTIVGIKI